MPTYGTQVMGFASRPFGRFAFFRLFAHIHLLLVTGINILIDKPLICDGCHIGAKYVFFYLSVDYVAIMVFTR